MKIIAVGKIKRDFVKSGIKFYQKQISKLNIIEIKQTNKELEGTTILTLLKPNDFVVALDIQGSIFTSEEFSKKLDTYKNNSKSLVFLIGGSTGLSDEVKLRADELISFSKLTFPHELFRLILIEQIYRAESIIAGKPYHK